MNGSKGFKGSAGAMQQGSAATGEKIPGGYKKASVSNFSPEMMELFQSLFQHLGPESFLSKLAGGDESFFEEMEQPAWRKFQEAQGQLGSRYSQLAPGAMSAQRGGGFQKAANQQSSDFAQDLASKRRGLQMEATKGLFDMSNSLLNQRPYENALVKKQPNPWMEMLGNIAGQVPQAAATYFGGGF
jgi:hypothetical protein